MKRFAFLAVLIFSIFVTNAQSSVPAPGQAIKGLVYITGATIHTATGQVIENGTLAFENGKITLIENGNVEPPKDAIIYQADGQHIYPGFISCNSILGLVEINAVRPTRDYREVGSFKPHVRSIIAYNTDSRVTPTVRSNGVLMAQIIPAGGRIPGSATTVQLDAWNWEDATIKSGADKQIMLNLPSYITKSGWWAEPGGIKPNEKYSKQIDEIKDFFKQAKAYCDKNEGETNLKFQAMCGLFDGTKSLQIDANHVKEIETAISFCNEFGLNMILTGGRDAWLLTKELKANNIKVILDPTHELPYRKDDDIDMPFKMPKMLMDDGIEVSMTSGNFYGDQRNLPFVAAKAVAYGLTKDEALQMITINPAKALGVDKEYGSLEVGKSATFIVSKGDALDILGNHIELAFIDGRPVNLDNKQKQLYRKFMNKYDKPTKQH